MKKSLADWALPISVLLVALALWEGAARAGMVAPYILPAPTVIVTKIVTSWRDLLPHLWVTALEVVLGFLLAVVVGVMLAAGVIYFRTFERGFYPWIVATQAVPKVALGPLIVIWFGFGLFPKIMIAALISFFPIMIATIAGLRAIQTESLLLMQSMGANSLQSFWYARLPNGLPHIFAGLKVSMIMASVGAIVGEFVGANEGLGYLLLAANATLDVPILYAALTLIALLGTLMFWVVHLLERIFISWHVSFREVYIAPTS